MRLHPDQEQFAGRLAERTHFDREVVDAWVHAVSGAGYRPGHDYLLPGVFPSAELAAEHAAKALDGTELAGAAAQGPLAQIVAIDASTLPGRGGDVLTGFMQGAV